MDRIFKQQTHHFLLLNALCMEKRRERYELECGNSTQQPAFIEWILPVVQADIAKKALVTQQELDIAIRPGEKADFFSMCWPYRKHFRIIARDFHKKSTCSCGVSTWYDIGGNKFEYYGYVNSIVRLVFDSFETVIRGYLD